MTIEATPSATITAEHLRLAREAGEVRVPILGLSGVSPEALASVSSPRTPAGRFRTRESQGGTTYSAGQVFGQEHNRDLGPRLWRGQNNRIGVVDKMVREDPVAQAIQLAVSLPLQAVTWDVVPASQDRDALADAAMVRAVLFERLEGGWLSTLEYLSSFSWRGFALAEIVAELDRSFRVEDADGQALFDGPALLPSCLAPMPPWTVKSWVPTGSPYRFGVEQYPNESTGGGGVVIPADKLVHPIYRSAGGTNPEGWSILRPSYAPYMLRRTLTVLEVTGYDRSAIGVPIATIPDGMVEADLAVVDEVLANLRSGARSFARLPEGVTLSFSDFPFKGADIREARRSAGQDMARSTLAPWLFTGDSAGAYSLIAGQLDLWGTMIRGLIDEIPRALRALIRKTVDWNRRDVGAYPKLVAGQLNIGDPAKLVEAIRAAADSDLLTPGPEIEAQIRSAVGAEPMPQETLDAWAARMRGRIEISDEDDEGEDPEDDDPPPSGGDKPKGSEDDDENRDDQEERPEGMHEHGPGCGCPDSLVLLLSDDATVRRDRMDTGPRGRALHEFELALRLSETAAPMLSAKEQSAEAVRAWREAAAQDYADALVAAGDLRSMRTVPAPKVGDLVAELVRVYRRAYLSGADSMQMEIDRLAQTRWEKEPPSQGTPGEDPRSEVALMESGLDTWDLVAELQERGAIGSLVPAGLDPDRPLEEQSNLWIYYRDKADRVGLFEAGGWALTVRDIEKAQERLRRATRDQETYVPAVPPPTGGPPPPVPVPRGSYKEAEKEARRLVEDWRSQRAVQKPAGLPGTQAIDDVRPEVLFSGLARTTAQRAQQRVQEAALNEAQASAVAGAVPEGDEAVIAAAIVATVGALSTGPDLNQGQADANEAFSTGREQSGRTEKLVEGWWFSNLLESQTCELCEEVDGRSVADEELDEYSTPYRRCLGGSKCNCLLFARIRPLE